MPVITAQYCALPTSVLVILTFGMEKEPYEIFALASVSGARKITL
jgi:hypothetical protein